MVMSGVGHILEATRLARRVVKVAIARTTFVHSRVKSRAASLAKEAEVTMSRAIGVMSQRLEQDLEAKMFLDRTDLSKSVNRHGKERCHVLSRSSRFFSFALLERQPVLAKNV